jgi:hypothetical protein
MTSDKKGKAMREDIHKPSMLDPAEYDFIAAFYQGDSPWIAQSYMSEMEIYDRAIGECDVFMGNFFHKQTCDHCGAAFNHGVLFLHTPTDELIHVGHICAAETVGLPSRAAKAKKTAEKFAREQKAREERQKQTKVWRDENEAVVNWLNSQDMETAHNFIKDMKRQLNDWGKLSERQAAAVEKWMAGQERFQERKAEEAKRLENALPLEEGRHVLIGEIVSTKYKDTDFGTQLKMTVLLDTGNKIYGTVPVAIQDLRPDNIVGPRINFTGTIKRSDRDEHFGFFSRPASARFV